MPISVGDRIGPYETLAPIGAGGMGEVWKARDMRLDRVVAIKISRQEFSERFEREARAISSLNHPNICQLYDIGKQADGSGYLVMEFVEGEPIRSPDSSRQLLDLATQIADGLAAAHAAGITHRDLKPDNILVSGPRSANPGRAQILDFGLAKRNVAAGQCEATKTIIGGATDPGTVLGTVAYMSPEQARGQEVDARSDQFSLGLILYELAAGKRAFVRDSAAETMAAIIRDDAPPLPASVPAPLRWVIERCLAKDPSERYDSTRDLYRELKLARQRISEVSTADVRPATAPAAAQQARWLWPSLTAASLALAAGTWGWLLTRPAPRPLQLTKFQIQAPGGNQLPIGTPAISPDGRTLVFAVQGSDHLNHLHVRSLDSTTSRELPGTEGAVHPFFSMDGKSIAFVDTANTVKRLELSGGSPRPIVTTTAPWHGAWTTTGDLVVSHDFLLQKIPAGGGNPIPLSSDGKGLSLGFPFFLRDGNRFLARMQTGNGYVVALAALNAPSPNQILDVASAPLIGRTPKGSYLLYLRELDLMAAPFDEVAAKVSGEANVLVEGIGRVATPPMMPAAGISDAGVLAFQNTGNGWDYDRAYWFDRSGKRLDAASLPNLNNRLSLSPDGRAVAFGSLSGSVGREEISVTDLSRSVTAKVAFGDGRFINPVWSPDGKRLAFRAYERGILEKNADGTGAERQLYSKDAVPLSYSPDGKYLLYLERSQYYLLSLDTGGQSIPVNSRKSTGQYGAISPDGKFIAYSSTESGSEQLYVERMPPATGRWQVSQGNGRLPRWRKDGKELFYDDVSGQIFAVDVHPGPEASVGAPKLLLPAGNSSGDFDVAPDGQRLLVRTRGGLTGNAPITVVQNWWLELEKK